MASWASIVAAKGKTTTQATTTQATTTQATTTQVTTTQVTTTQVTARQVSIEPTTTSKKEESVALEQKKEHQLEAFQVHKKYLEELEERDKEEMGNRMPLFAHIVRPETHPAFAPIFKDVSHKIRWEQEQWRLNQEYSSMIHDQRVAAWEKKNNWFPVPLMTEITEEQKQIGFVPITESSLYKVGYLCPHNSDETRQEYLYFLLRLLFNRSEEVCACKTVGEFERVYLEAMNFTRCSDEEWTPAELKREHKTASNALWALSTKANLFPGKRVNPRAAPSNDVSSVRHQLKTGQKRYDVIGVERGETGVYGVKDAKTLGNLAPIRWCMTPAEMRNLKEFQFTFQYDPRLSYLYDFDWSDDGFY